MATFTNRDGDRTLKERLEFLGCPYTEEMDEDNILNLLTNPGEIRLKVFHWLFSHYDPDLAEFLEQPLGGRSDLKIQRLVNVANALCLCSSNDVELIKGNAPLNKQQVFINRLLELVCLREKACSLENTLDSRPDMYASNLEMLVTQDGFMRMFESPGSLLPRDISNEVESLKLKQGKKENIALSLQELLSLSEELNDEIQSNQLILNQLQKEISVQDENKHQEVLMMSHMLCSLLKELRQLSEAFSHCYVSNLSQWCNKSPPELSQLGATMKRVQESLQGLTQNLSHMNEIRQTQTKLNKLVKKEYTVFPVIKDEQSKEISESFQQCLNILEETLHRCESRFISSQPSILSV